MIDNLSSIEGIDVGALTKTKRVLPGQNRDVFDIIANHYHHQRERSSLNKEIIDNTVQQLLAQRRYSRALDIGCGIGTYCRMLKPYSSEIIGLDTNKKMLRFARSRKDGITYTSINFLRFREHKKFDLIIFSLVLDHVENFQDYLVKARRILSFEGRVLCILPNPVKDSCIQHKECGAILTSYFNEGPQKKYRRDEQGQILCTLSSFKRTLPTYINTFISEGLSLIKIVEPKHPNQNHPAHHVPYFTILEFCNGR